jgi:hypothetical protein
MKSRQPRRLVYRAPYGLLGMVALIVLIESFVIRPNDALMSVHSSSWRNTAQHIRHAIKASEILCFGDSLLKYGIYPEVVEGVTHKKTFNLAVTNGPSPASYVLLKRVLDRGEKPKLIVADFDFNILEEGPRSSCRPYPWADLLDLGETGELAWTARDPDLFVRIVLDKLLHSQKSRFEIREAIVCSLQDKLTWLQTNRGGVIRNWNRHRGAQVNAKWPVQYRPMPPREGIQPGQPKWPINSVNRAYLDRFFSLAERNDIPVFWVLPPMSPWYIECERWMGKASALQVVLQQAQARHPGLVIVDGRHSNYDGTVSNDSVHLDIDGATNLSAGLGQLANAYFEAPHAFPRWVELPPYRQIENRHPLETVAESIAIDRTNQADERLRR